MVHSQVLSTIPMGKVKFFYQLSIISSILLITIYFKTFQKIQSWYMLVQNMYQMVPIFSFEIISRLIGMVNTFSYSNLSET